MPDREVTLGITCPNCKTRNVLIVRDFEGEELIQFKCVGCGYQQEFQHPDANLAADKPRVEPMSK